LNGAVPSISKTIINIAIVVMLIALIVVELKNKIKSAAIIINMGITLNTTLYSFNVLSVRFNSES